MLLQTCWNASTPATLIFWFAGKVSSTWVLPSMLGSKCITVLTSQQVSIAGISLLVGSKHTLKMFNLIAKLMQLVLMTCSVASIDLRSYQIISTWKWKHVKLVKTGQNWSLWAICSTGHRSDCCDTFRCGTSFQPAAHPSVTTIQPLSIRRELRRAMLGFNQLQGLNSLANKQYVASSVPCDRMWCSGAERHGGELVNYMVVIAVRVWKCLEWLFSGNGPWKPGNGPCFCPLVLHSTSFGWRLHRHQTVPDLNLMPCWPASYTCFVHVGMCRSFGEKKTKDIKDIKDISGSCCFLLLLDRVLPTLIYHWSITDVWDPFVDHDVCGKWRSRPCGYWAR